MNDYDAYSVNNLTAQKGEDGSVDIQFGGCDGKIPNCLRSWMAGTTRCDFIARVLSLSRPRRFRDRPCRHLVARSVVARVLAGMGLGYCVDRNVCVRLPHYPLVSTIAALAFRGHDKPSYQKRSAAQCVGKRNVHCALNCQLAP